jgi:predicted phage terminase large subunit-like protein
VYNLDVEGEHEFFANGILTHNSWLYAQAAWDNIMFGLRLGAHPRLCVTGTPKPSAFIRDLMKRKDAVVVVGSTYENRDNLTESYFENVAKYEGTKIGRQEIHGEVLDPEEAGYIKRSQIRMWPADRPLPRFQYILVSLDTAFTEETHDKKRQENDPTACTVWGLFLHGQPAVKNIMLLDAWQEWLGFPELIQRVKKERRRRYGAIVQGPVLLRPKINSVQTPQPQGKAIDLLLIEEKASGTSLIQMLAREDILAHAYNPGNLDKLQRLHVVSLLPAHGRVWMVESDRTPGEFREWAEPVITQLCSYSGEGSLDYDDLLDTTTQAWRYLLDHHIGALTIPRDPEEERRKAAVEARHKIERKQRVNPYDG